MTVAFGKITGAINARSRFHIELRNLGRRHRRWPWRGYHDADDPLNDDVDEFGQVECDYCNGTGLREHQSIF